jgi:hypothetical protein
MGHLAEAYKGQRKLKEAEKLCLQVKGVFLGLFGLDHPSRRYEEEFSGPGAPRYLDRHSQSWINAHEIGSMRRRRSGKSV